MVAICYFCWEQVLNVKPFNVRYLNMLADYLKSGKSWYKCGDSDSHSWICECSDLNICSCFIRYTSKCWTLHLMHLSVFVHIHILVWSMKCAHDEFCRGAKVPSICRILLFPSWLCCSLSLPLPSSFLNLPWLFLTYY